MRAFAVSLSRDPALSDDLVQDAVERAWNNFDKFKPGTNLRAWLFTILRNIYYSGRRKAARESMEKLPEEGAVPAVKPDHDGRLALRDFRQAFDTLNDEQREALILVGASGLSYEEAAQTCDVAVGTIKSRVNRGRRRLTELLGLIEGDKLELTDKPTMAVVFAGRGGPVIS